MSHHPHLPYLALQELPKYWTLVQMSTCSSCCLGQWLLVDPQGFFWILPDLCQWCVWTAFSWISVVTQTLCHPSVQNSLVALVSRSTHLCSPHLVPASNSYLIGSSWRTVSTLSYLQPPLRTPTHQPWHEPCTCSTCRLSSWAREEASGRGGWPLSCSLAIQPWPLPRVGNLHKIAMAESSSVVL